MIAREARTQLESLDTTILAARERASELSGFHLYDAAHKAVFNATYGDGSYRSFDHMRASTEAQTVGKVLSYLGNPMPDDELPLGSRLEEIVERRETVRAYLLDILPKLNEALDLGITFEGGEIDG